MQGCDTLHDPDDFSTPFACTIQPSLAMVPINLIEFTMTYFDNKVSLPEFR